MVFQSNIIRNEKTLQSDTSVSDKERLSVLNALEGKTTKPIKEVSEPLLLTMTDAAKFLGVSRVTFWRMVKDEVFQPLEVRPNMFRYQKVDLINFSERRKNPPLTQMQLPS